MSVITRLLTDNLASELSVTASGSDISCSFKLSAFNRLNPSRYPYLLSSSAIGQNNSRYDILLAYPQFTLTLDTDKNLHCTKTGHVYDTADSFLTTLDSLFAEDKTPLDKTAEQLPFTGGWFVYLSYEMAEEIEPCLSLPSSTDSHPLAFAARCPAAIIFDKNNDEYIAVAETAYAHLLDELEQDFITIKDSGAETDIKNAEDEHTIKLQSLSEAGTQPYLQQVEKIKEYIVDGDIFQANLSRQWQAVLSPDQQGHTHNSAKQPSDATLFDALANNNPSSFAALACLPGMSIISSSPERLVSLRHGIVETRPIAGTRPRHDNQQDDEALAEELLAHPKEQAEHIMLIDLERNDLGRVCRPGSIEVNELMVLESWQHVHHIVSNVRGELEADRSPVDVLRAVFPGGTITGCPKVRCIEILAEMEQQARGAYTGSLGYINNDGSMDFNILIRTMVRDTADGQDRLTFRAGGGIVSDSVAEKELDETRAKAKGLLKMFHIQLPENS